MNDFVLACFEDMVKHIGEPCDDGGKCWCGWPDINPRKKYHTAVCHELRKYFNQLHQEKDNGKNSCDAVGSVSY